MSRRGARLRPQVEGTSEPCARRRRPAGLAAAGRGRPLDHRGRPDPVRAAGGDRRPPRRGADALRRGPGRPRPAAHRARPPHALPPRPGLLPGRLDRPGRDAPRGRPARGARRRPGSTRPACTCSPSCPSCGCRRATSRSPRCWAGGTSPADVAVVDPDEVHEIFRVADPRAGRPDAPDRRTPPERLARPGLPDRRRQGRHPLGLHRRHRGPALRLPGLDPPGRGRAGA